MQAEKEKHRKEAAERMAADRQRKEDMMKRAELEEPPEQKAKYGTLPPNSYAGTPRADPRIDIRSLTPTMAGQVVSFRARIHNLRKMSAHMMFIEFRQHMATIQGVLLEHANISQFFLYWAEHLHVESVVHVIGVVQEPKTKQGEVRGTTIHNIEIHIHDMHVEAEPSVPLPFTVHEAEVTKAEADREGDSRHCLSDRARQTSRILDLRTQASQGIFRIQSGICQAFRAHLHELGFIEIHTPKLQGAASESGASVFKVEYFGRPAFLAQSPQLGKQMAIAADMRRVFEIGPVFRAENSNTHRHLTEFTGLDLEMAIDEHYHEILRVLDSTFKAIFSFIYTRYQPEIAAVKRQFPHDDLVWLEKTPVIPFAEAIRMLNETGWTDEDGKPLSENEDLGTRDEIQLGTVIKERLGTDYYVLDKFPTSARPFYAMPDPNDPKVTNSFDIFVRGQEILSGGQRIHDANMLKAKMESLKMDPSTLEEYVEGFEWGAPPHGGGGIGLERILMLMLKLNDIRQASMFMRDPRSLPYTPPTRQLRHPEASTLHPPWEKDPEGEHEMQPIEKLIANYGDASNTSWLEPRFETWRDRHTGAAVGYVPHQGYAIIIGDPLCHSTQLGKTIGGFLRFVKKELHLKPLWLLCNHKVEELLGDRHDWRTFSVVAEQRIDLVDNVAGRDKELERKCRHAEKEGIKIHTVPLGSEMSPEVRKQIDVRVQDWLRNRKGKQVHLTDVHPWQDMPHRTYHYSVTPDGTIAGLIIMAQLSPENGLQVKFSLDFPGAPSGAIEYLVVHALRQASAAGETRVTFGAGATGNFTVGRNMKGARVRVLTRAYLAIASELKLTNKSEFRQKLGAKEDPVYICYPPRGLGAGGVRAIMSFFEDGDGNSTV
ncbi:aspartyl-tRNA synthetase [Piedraia hortae CBS 480.64]|uniref:aspartate--tRNA ligase n=1 Tax=Piedraia hortae CBS 480.64 TaxID=1314780 RepID=A0A6A7BU95_9PEZI|nr:aspartyl-tRNA synthetase [Piedraia hortae CBS 480.64]